MNNVSDIHTLPRQPLWEHPLHCSMHVFRSLVGQAAHRSHLVDRYLTTRSLHKPSLPTDAILLKGLQFFGYHGVLKEARFKRLLFEADFNQRSWPVSKHWNTSLSDEQEQTLGQKFSVDARLTCCLKAAGRSDDIEDTVSYAEIFSDIQQIMEGPPHALLESVASTISRQLLDKYQKIESVELRLTKPHVAVSGNFESLGIETIRYRHEMQS